MAVLPVSFYYRSHQKQQISEILIKKNFEKKVSICQEFKKRISLVGKKSETKKWEVFSDHKTPKSYSLSCIVERLASLMSGSKVRRILVKLGSKKAYKHVGIEGGKICNDDLYKCFQQRKQFIYKWTIVVLSNILKMGGHNKILSDLRNLGLRPSKWDHNYCRVFIGNPEFKCRSAVKIHIGLE